MSRKAYFLVRFDILGLFRNTLTPDDMYFRHRWEKLQQMVQTLLSQKRKTFFGISIAFFKATQNFADFENKERLHILNMSEVIDPDKCCYFNAFKLLV